MDVEVPDQKRLSRSVITIIAAIVAALVGLTALVWQDFGTSQIITPTSFKECTQAKESRIQESFPEVCVSVDGERFINPEQSGSF